jgi:hypothetical protein
MSLQNLSDEIVGALSSMIDDQDRLLAEQSMT